MALSGGCLGSTDNTGDGMDLGSCFQEDVGLLASSLKWISATALAGGNANDGRGVVENGPALE